MKNIKNLNIKIVLDGTGGRIKKISTKKHKMNEILSTGLNKSNINWIPTLKQNYTRNFKFNIGDIVLIKKTGKDGNIVGIVRGTENKIPTAIQYNVKRQIWGKKFDIITLKLKDLILKNPINTTPFVFNSRIASYELYNIKKYQNKENQRICITKNNYNNSKKDFFGILFDFNCFNIGLLSNYSTKNIGTTIISDLVI